MSLLRLLTWTDDPAEVLGYEKTFRQKAETRLVAAVKACERRDGTTARVLQNVLESLPADRVLRVAGAPELEFRLREARTSEGGAAALEGFLAESLQAELCLHDSSVRRVLSRPPWTALGECCSGVPAGDARSSSDDVRVAPRVGSSIPIDFDSPHHRGDLPFRFPDHANYRPSERAAVAEKLDAAFSLVRLGGPQVTNFVLAFTRVVVPLRVDSVHRWFGSFSSSWYPGRSVLVNVHLPDMGHHETAAALVHEAIHSLVDASELEGRLLLDGRRVSEKVCSPWTGARISLQSLLDAYFVWFGLLHFWKAVAARSGAGRDTYDGLIERCRRGFAPPFSQVVGGEALSSVHPFVLDAIESLRAAVGSIETARRMHP